jgi:hypothetical protein
MASMSHENCGLDYDPMNQMEHSHHVKKLANEIGVSDHQMKVCINKKGTRRTGSQSMMNGIERRLLE